MREHAATWIDHREARVFHFGLTDIETLVLHPDNPTRYIHHKANSIVSGHASTTFAQSSNQFQTQARS
jgi:hypothetical protein